MAVLTWLGIISSWIPSHAKTVSQELWRFPCAFEGSNQMLATISQTWLNLCFFSCTIPPACLDQFLVLLLSGATAAASKTVPFRIITSALTSEPLPPPFWYHLWMNRYLVWRSRRWRILHPAATQFKIKGEWNMESRIFCLLWQEDTKSNLEDI